MEELITMLNNVEDSYYDFVSSISYYAEKKQSRLDALLEFMREHPNAKSSDIIKFVSDQKDFFEDAACIKVG